MYDTEQILEKLPDSIFDLIAPADKVVIKPNWVRHSHLGREGDSFNHQFTKVLV